MKPEIKSMPRRRIFAAAVAALAATFGAAQAQTENDINPAARTHVKIVDGQAVKFSSKLTKVIELNFTFGFHHSASKPIISQTLTRVAEDYGTDGVPAFTVQRHVGPNGGSASGLPEPDFTLADLVSGQVIFANQISAMGSNSLGAARRQAIQTAVEGGVGYFHLHGSGDDETRQWSWYTNSLHPMNYASHGANTNGPVYKNPAEKDHIVTENVLVTGMHENRMVPTSVDENDNEVVTEEPIRMIRNEWYRFGNDIRTDPLHADKVTVLSLYDPRDFTNDMLAPQYRYKGGNMYTYLFRVGNGMTHYLPAGHDNLEIMGEDGFDGGVGDWDRYFAQVLFFLAGYNEAPCDETCLGLPVVDENNHLTGEDFEGTSVDNYTLVSSDLKVNRVHPEFTYIREARYEARLMTPSGRVVQQSRGTASRFSFDTSRLSDGVYFMHVKIDGTAARVQRYAIASGL